MNTVKHPLVWLLLIIWLAPGMVLAAKSRLIGKVLDPDGKPIVDVTVTATSEQVPDFNGFAGTGPES